MANKLDRNPTTPDRVRRNFQRLADILEVEHIGSVASAPVSTIAVVAWLKVIVDGVEYRLPLYQ